MKVRVRFYGIAFENIGTRELEYEIDEDSTVKQLVRMIAEKHPEINSLVNNERGVYRDYLEIAVNETDIIGLNGLDTRLHAGDFVQIMPPIGGG